MMYLGDFRLTKVVRFLWNSNAIAGESITRATNGTISVYKDASTTQSTTGVTDTEDYDSLTGIHFCAIDTSSDGTFYSAGADFHVVLSGATIDGKAINAVLAHFSLENRSALMPTTSGRTLDVSAGGEAGLDWANVGTPGSTVSLTATTVATVTTTATATATTTVNGLAAGVITAASIASDAFTAAKFAADVATEFQSGLATAAALDTVDNFLDTEIADIQARLPAALVSGRIDASVGAMASGTLTATAIAADAITAAKVASDVGTEIATAVLTTQMTEAYNTDGTAPTLAQAMFVTMQRLTEFAISSTTITVKKLDGSTSAYTLTLDSASSPTSSTRAT